MKNIKFRIGVVLIGLSLVMAVLLGCSSPAQAGGSGVAGLAYAAGNGDMTYTINVNGSGVATTQPDVADVRFGVESINANASEGVSENTAKMKAVMEAIKALGIEEQDIQTTEYSMWVEQVYDPEQGVPTGEMRYHITNQVNVKLHDISLVGQLLEGVLDAGANTVSGVTFGVDDPTALQSQAREQALEQARARAEELAAGLGVKVGKVHQVSEYSSGYAPTSAAMKLDMGGGDISIASGSYNVTVEVQVVFDIIQ
ncbi:MAG: SIMPL domain-containing protein [Anaerolineae bacterium]|nr:SIMPL domain-containing protein [Anaerolineae bacterium]